MSERQKREYNIWYCDNCGMTYRRGIRDPDNMACGNCNTWPMRLARVYWHDETPDPDPLQDLLVAVSDD